MVVVLVVVVVAVLVVAVVVAVCAQSGSNRWQIPRRRPTLDGQTSVGGHKSLVCSARGQSTRVVDSGLSGDVAVLLPIIIVLDARPCLQPALSNSSTNQVALFAGRPLCGPQAQAHLAESRETSPIRPGGPISLH